MEGSILKKSISIKLIFLIVLFIIFICTFCIAHSSVNKSLDKDKVVKDSYKEIYNSFITKFFTCLELADYESAFNILDEQYKSTAFDNDISKFSSIIKNKYINNDICEKRYEYKYLPQEIKNEVKVLCTLYCKPNSKVNSISVKDLKSDDFLMPKEIVVTIVENAPFNYNIKLDLDSEV